MRTLLLFFLVETLCLQVSAQRIIELPAAAEQTHPELIIERISIYNDSTVVQLSVENKMEQGGWFCADRNIYIENPTLRMKYRLIRARGIPACPSVHNFKRAGEVLRFSLIFPGIPENLRVINLIEDCNKSCFRFKGVILDGKLNEDIRLYNRGVEHYAANRLDEAVECFARVVETIPAFPTHVYGYSYYNLVRIHADKGDTNNAAFWTEQLKSSPLPDKEYFIDLLRREKLTK